MALYTRLLLARAVTRRLREVPGAVIAMERMRRWGVSHAGTIVVNDFDGDLKFELELSGHMGSQIFWYGSYSRHVLRILGRILEPGMTVLDVGANAGEITVFCAKRVGSEGTVFSFEPLDALHARLVHNVTLNGFDNVRPQKVALGESPGRVSLYAAADPFHDGSTHEGLATMFPDEVRSSPMQEVDLTTVDLLHGAGLFDRVDVMKVDVEGAELAVLRGALATLGAHRPWIVIEVQTGTSTAAGYDQNEILTLLRDLGYTFRVIDRACPLRPLDEANLKPFQNVLAVPEGRHVP